MAKRLLLLATRTFLPPDDTLPAVAFRLFPGGLVKPPGFGVRD